MIRQTVFGFKMERTQEELTAHGGLALMAEYSHGLGLRELVGRNLPGPGSNRGYDPVAYVESLVLMLQAGGRSLEDLRELKGERALMRLIGREEIPDPDSVGDWLRRMGDPAKEHAGLLGLGRVRDQINTRILRRDGIREYTLDMDATQIEAEKREARFTYQKVKGYMPMLGFLFEAKLCLLEEFREGNESPGAGHVAFYRQCKERMPRGKRIGYFRADSASYQSELINELEAHRVRFAITADQDKAVRAIIEKMPEGQWREPKKDCGYEIAEAVHSTEKAQKAFRLISKRELCRQPDLFNGEKYVYHVVASNWPEEQKSAWEVLIWHQQRGQAENFNKELKLGFGMEQMPCGQSFANAVFFRIGVIAYNLFIGFKRLSCPQSWETHTIGTFRWKMLEVAGRIVRHAGQVVLKLCVNPEKLAVFEAIRWKSFELCLST